MRHRPASDPKAPDATNYDESKANVYPNLPDPLMLKNGQRVTSATQWMQRRKEIREDVDREILGRAPVSQPGVTWHVISTTNEKYGGVDVVTKRIAGQVGPWKKSRIKFILIFFIISLSAGRFRDHGTGIRQGLPERR